jgi:hypothetical protein
MAYYVVIYQGKRYYSRASIKAVRGIGDSGLLQLITLGEVTTRKILDVFAYAEKSETDLDQCLVSRHIIMQNIDVQLEHLAGACTDDTLSAFVSYKLPKDKRKFIPFDEIRVPDRYRWIVTQPHIKVFGKKYVALA